MGGSGLKSFAKKVTDMIKKFSKSKFIKTTGKIVKTVGDVGKVVGPIAAALLPVVAPELAAGSLITSAAMGVKKLLKKKK